MPTAPPSATPPASSPAPHAGAVAYWDGVLDSQNLEREEAGHGIPLQREIDFAESPDFLCAAAWLEGSMGSAVSVSSRQLARPQFIIDLGAGLGANAFALARRGHRVVAIDSSPARLRALYKRAHAAGCAERIVCIAALAEHLPFASGGVPALFTKSVLIHTELPAAAAELARVLEPGGRAALDEPQPGNPFVNLYRNTLAPKAWQGITQYFGAPQQAVFARAVEGRWVPKAQVQPRFLFSFFAFVFQFALPQIALFRIALALLKPIDSLLFMLIPPLRKWAWFGVITLEKPLQKTEKTGDGR